MNEHRSLIGERRLWSRLHQPLTAVGVLADWVWAQPDSLGRPFSIARSDWMEMPLDPSSEAATETPHHVEQIALIIGPIKVNPTLRTVSTHDGESIRLTRAEHDMVGILAMAHGETCSREMLFPKALGRTWSFGDRSIDQLAFSLRRKLPQDENGLPLVRTHRARGYWMRPPCRVETAGGMRP